MKRKEYERELRRLHGELVALQEWVKASGAKVCIVFEGRDTAGKGGTIKRDHRAGQPARVPGRRAAGADRAREVADVHPALHPALPGRRRGRDLRPQLVQPRRRRARHGLLHRRARRDRFLEQVPAVEKAMVDSGIILLKYWLEVSPDEQTRRLESRIDDPRKVWKLSDMDLKSYSRWYDYSRARDAMFAATDTAWAPWFVADTDDKKRGRLNIITHLLGQIPYEPLDRPRRQAAEAAAARRLPRARPAVAAHPDAVLTML